VFDKAKKIFHRKYWKKGVAAAVILILIVVGTVWWMNRPQSVNVNSDIQSKADAAAFFSGLDVTADLPKGESRNFDGVPWFKAYEQKKTALWFDPKSGQVAVEDKSNGKIWRSNPDSAALAKDTTKGLWRSHLESPFVLSYFNAERTLIKDTNLKEFPTTVTWQSIDEGVALMYVVEELLPVLRRIPSGGRSIGCPYPGTRDIRNERELVDGASSPSVYGGIPEWDRRLFAGAGRSGRLDSL